MRSQQASPAGPAQVALLLTGANNACAHIHRGSHRGCRHLVPVRGRYSYLPAGKAGYALRIDRLSGVTLKCGTAGCHTFFETVNRDDTIELAPVL
jgi:hypothetical protein